MLSDFLPPGRATVSTVQPGDPPSKVIWFQVAPLSNEQEAHSITTPSVKGTSRGLPVPEVPLLLPMKWA